MEIAVWVEPISAGRYRASALTLSAEGATADEAREKLHLLVQARLAQGTQVTNPVAPDSKWPPTAGIWDGDDPVIAEWKRIMEENRRAEESEGAA